ncbi:hypothetical protein [Mycolicibacter arupensis]|nr:hypothetical protein [Mycolicibacter arupensis]MCV7274497.1 hypothetical protein [Mycolicibacter arupensis]
MHDSPDPAAIDHHRDLPDAEITALNAPAFARVAWTPRHGSPAPSRATT